ncbi:MAG: competence protein CoiA family protein [Acidovorax sp.]|nr:competence protein CoiA family protein [Acidovorax sp.]
MHFAHAADGSIVDVTEVPRGSACACVCLGCGAPLVAKQGKANTWHFGHASGASHRACAESALHLAGKELLRELTEVLVPKVSCTVAAFDILQREHTQTVEAAASAFEFTSCVLEHSSGTRRLDALLESPDGRRLGIEILVTHKVDEQKAQDLASLNASVLELDLSSWVGKPLDHEILKAVLAAGAPRAIVAGAQILLESKVSKLKAALEQRLEKTAEAAQAVLALSPVELLEGQKIVDRMGLPATPWPQWLDWDGWLKGQDINELPQKLFGLHHTVWQAACAEFVQTRPGGRQFTVQEALEGVEQNLFGMPDGSDDARFTAISDFLGEHLVSKGLIRFCGNDDHGWGDARYQAKTWTPRILASALAVDRRRNKPPGSEQMGLF